MPKEYKWTPAWSVQCEHDEVQVGQVIVVRSKTGAKRVRVTDIVVRKTKSDKAYDLLFTVDVD